MSGGNLSHFSPAFDRFSPECLLLPGVEGEGVDGPAAGASDGAEAVVAPKPDDAARPRRHLLAGAVGGHVPLAVHPGLIHSTSQFEFGGL